MNAKPHPPLWQWSATDLAKAIREKTRSSQDVIQAHLDRIDAVNPAVNAVTVVLEDDALRMAREADEKIAAGESVGRLHGVPITVKESFDVVGSATTHGIVALKDSMSQADAPVVAHLKQAGAIPIGRTNLPDYGLRYHTDNDLHGATLNPGTRRERQVARLGVKRLPSRPGCPLSAWAAIWVARFAIPPNAAALRPFAPAWAGSPGRARRSVPLLLFFTNKSPRSTGRWRAMSGISASLWMS